MNNRTAIRAFYAACRLEVMACRNEWAEDDAYAWDHIGRIEMTPIERWLWSDIRSVDAVLYPQYPVGPFFVDFGNPVAKVAIECDGAEWHKDKQKDAERDAHLAELGWTVYRITGKECRTQYDQDKGTVGAAYELVKEIAERHRIRRGMA
jgi:very-short-patch-repair endonuclease